MSGTAIADAAGLGTIEIKAMKDHGYNTEFSVGVMAASATLGPIIPPSLLRFGIRDSSRIDVVDADSAGGMLSWSVIWNQSVETRSSGNEYPFVDSVVAADGGLQQRWNGGSLSGRQRSNGRKDLH